MFGIGDHMYERSRCRTPAVFMPGLLLQRYAAVICTPAAVALHQARDSARPRLGERTIHSRRPSSGIPVTHGGAAALLTPRDYREEGKREEAIVSTKPGASIDELQNNQ